MSNVFINDPLQKDWAPHYAKCINAMNTEDIFGEVDDNSLNCGHSHLRIINVQ